MIRPSLTIIAAVCAFLVAPTTPAQIARDIDTPSYVQFSAPRFEVSETETNAIITVLRTGDYRKTASVDFATRDGAAVGNIDFLPTGGTLTFSAGQSIKTISIPILRDSRPEPGKTFQVELGQPSANAFIISPPADVEIKPAGPPLQIALDAAGFRISWADAGEAFKLETQLDGAWVEVSASPTLAEKTWSVVLDGERALALFRLRLDTAN